MTLYTNGSRPACLDSGDYVTFTVGGYDYRYVVECSFLDFQGTEGALNPPLGGNDTIFGILAINKLDYCRRYYTNGQVDSCEGEGEINGYWPEIIDDDYNGLTRLVNALYDLCEGSQANLNEPDMDWESRLESPEKFIRILEKVHQVLALTSGTVKRWDFRHKFNEADRNFAEYCLKPYLAAGLLEKTQDEVRTYYTVKEPQALAEILSRFRRKDLRLLASPLEK